jgi:hypothetical protein
MYDSIYGKLVKTGEMKEAAKLLLDSGNYEGAAGLLNEMYGPLGVKVDFSSLINERNSDNFSSGMASIGQVADVPAVDTWEEAEPALRYAGVFNNITDPALVRSMWEAARLQNDPIFMATAYMTDDSVRAFMPEGSTQTVDEWRVEMGKWSATGLVRQNANGEWEYDSVAIKKMYGNDTTDDVFEVSPNALYTSLVTSFPPEGTSGIMVTDKTTGKFLEPIKAHLATLATDAEKQAYYAKETTADNDAQWYRTNGFVDTAVPPTRFNVSMDGVADALDWYKGQSYTNEQLTQLANSNPKFLAGLPKDWWSKGGKSGMVDAWNSSIGKLVLVDGQAYMVGNINWTKKTGDQYMVYDPNTGGVGRRIKQNNDGTFTFA